MAGAFFIGRLVSYSLYVGSAGAAHKSLAKLFRQGLTSPAAIATQVIAVVVLIAIIKIDWPTTIDKVRAWCAAQRGRPKPRPIREALMAEAPTAPVVAKREP